MEPRSEAPGYASRVEELNPILVVDLAKAKDGFAMVAKSTTAQKPISL
jgi:hypothetical protein